MGKNDDPETKLFFGGDLGPNPKKELSKIFDVLGNEKRLMVLDLLKEGPKDVGTIARGIKTSYENTTNHVKKLHKIHIIRKEAGFKENKTVKNYDIDYNVLEDVLQKIEVFFNELKGIDHKFPFLRVSGGMDDGKIFKIKKGSVKVGRVDHKKIEMYDFENDIVLSEEYKAVTRISNPHAILDLDDDIWYIKDCGSKGGTFINKEELGKNIKKRLNEGDVIGLAEGSFGVRLLFSYKLK